MIRRLATLSLLAAVATACAGVPSDRYGVDEVVIEGDTEMDNEAILACLATEERPAWRILLGQFGSPSCGSPPFEGDSKAISLWTWPWTEWPLFDELVFERDLERVVRWYNARGHFDARVVETRIEPAAAADGDIVDEATDCERRRSDEGCLVRITIVVEEGLPTTVSQVALRGTDALDPRLVDRLEGALAIHEGERFDEAQFEESKRKLQSLLIENSYARATVRGRARVNRETRLAEIDFEIAPGPPCVFGGVFVENNEDLPAHRIRAAARLVGGEPYSTSGVREVQHAVYNLGAFASVNVQPRIPSEGNVIDLTIDVVPARRTRFLVGAGIQSGMLRQRRTDQTEQIPQWDVHLRAVWEHRNFFGGLRRFRIEEQPRLIFTAPFPRPVDPTPGNILSLGFSQPAFLEPRTKLVMGVRYTQASAARSRSKQGT